jgi:hypothetical protein
MDTASLGSEVAGASAAVHDRPASDRIGFPYPDEGFTGYPPDPLGGDLPSGFDGLQYIASHPDLIDVFGTDEAAGVQHYLQFGQAEGRLIDSFDEEQYLENYTDLQAAFGGGTEAATVHYITFGSEEGRTDDPVASAADFLIG